MSTWNKLTSLLYVQNCKLDPIKSPKTQFKITLLTKWRITAQNPLFCTVAADVQTSKQLLKPVQIQPQPPGGALSVGVWGGRKGLLFLLVHIPTISSIFSQSISGLFFVLPYSAASTSMSDKLVAIATTSTKLSLACLSQPPWLKTFRMWDRN